MPVSYLELSAGGTHKFYEVTQRSKSVTVRYGRIGTTGTSKLSAHESPKLAKAYADKQIKGKEAKGYAEATKGTREKKAVLSGKAPVIWKFKTTASALGVHVDKDRCWVGDDGGQVFALDHKANVIAQYDLGAGVKAIVADDRWIYAGNDNGQVFDLNRKVPTVAYEVKGANMICWMDIFSGTLLVSDGAARCTAYDHEGDKRWEKKVKGKLGWMVRADADGVYHGIGGWSSPGVVTAFDWDGKKRWQHTGLKGGVGFGWQTVDKVYASTCSHGAGGGVHIYDKDGSVGPFCKCDSGVLSCATTPDGKYIFAGDGRGYIYCFNDAGNRLWKLETKVGSAQSMQFFEDKLYLVTDHHFFASVDVSEAAIAHAGAGKVRVAKSVKSSKTTARKVGDTLGTAAADDGVVVECRAEGTRLRVFPVDGNFDATWRVQFPRDLRVDGARFVVDELVEASQGGFYRVVGDIRRLTAAKKATAKKTTAKKTTAKKTAAKKTAAKKTAAKKTAAKKTAAKKTAAKKTAAKKTAAKKTAAKKTAAKKR